MIASCCLPRPPRWQQSHHHSIPPSGISSEVAMTMWCFLVLLVDLDAFPPSRTVRATGRHRADRRASGPSRSATRPTEALSRRRRRRRRRLPPWTTTPSSIYNGGCLRAFGPLSAIVDKYTTTRIQDDGAAAVALASASSLEEIFPVVRF